MPDTATATPPVVRGPATGLTLDSEAEAMLHELGLEEPLRRYHALEADYRRDDSAATALYFQVTDANSDRLAAESEFAQDQRQHEAIQQAMAPAREEAHKTNIARKRKDQTETNALHTAATAKLTNTREVLRNPRDYLLSLPKDATLMPCPVDAKCPKGLTPKQAAHEERKRAKSTLFAEADRLKAGRAGIEADLEAYRQRLLSVVERDTFSVVYSSGQFLPRFPMETVDAESRGQSIPVAAAPFGLLVESNFDKYLAEGEKVIKAFYERNDVLTISEEDKRARLRALASEVLESERIEAHFLWMARAEGDDTATFRPDIDPRALLGISGPPAPRKRR